MSNTREPLQQLVDGLPEQDGGIGGEFAQSIHRALGQADSGQTVVCHNYGEMVEEILGD